MMAKKERYDLIVIGAGPGGYVAAVRAAQLGLKVVCIERAPRVGGVCLNVGCIPSKALLDSSGLFHLARDHFAAHGIRTGRLKLDLSTMMTRKERVVEELTENIVRLLERNKIRLIHGVAHLKSPNRVAILEPSGAGKRRSLTVEGETILLATGSEPLPLPGIGFDGHRIVSATDALAFKEVPRHLVVVGAGYIGLELGSVWLRLGAKVTVLEMLPKIATTLDGQVSRALARILKREGMEIRLRTQVNGVRVFEKRVQVVLLTKGKEEKLNAVRVLVAIGRRPMTDGLGLEAVGVKINSDTGHVPVNESYQTNIRNIYAIGDLVPGPMLAHKASAEGIAAAECITGLPGEVNYDAIPAVIYTRPEVASVGLTEEQVKARDVPHCIGTYPFAGTGRARCMGETEGFVKLIAHAKTDRILGVHVIGPRAAEMIAEANLAIEFGASAEDIARTVHGHPTFSEALHEAAMAVRKCAIHV